jgi:uncharacterized protein YoxC
MELSARLELALFIASIAFIILVMCIIPAVLLALRQLGQMATAFDPLQQQTQALLTDCLELVRNLNGLSQKADRQMEDMGKVVRTAEQWTERADRIANEVTSVIEPPLSSVARNITLIRTGVSVFLRVLAHANKNKFNEKEKNHV